MRCPGVGNSFGSGVAGSMIPFALRPRLNEPGRSVLVAFVQGVVRPGHEHLPPLHEARGKKARDRAKDDFLGEGGAHGCFYEAEAVPGRLPKSPLPGGHYPGAKEQIGHRVGDNARRQASCPISDEIVERAR